MAVGADDRWHPGIGDPTPIGWVTVGAYALVVLLAARAALAQTGDRGSPMAPAERRRLVRFWLVVALGMLLLGINKQLDLQSWFTQTARDLSKQEGWYESRRRYQVAFIVALAGTGALAILAAAVRLRGVWQQVGAAVVGLGVVVTFVVIRAASFHHVDLMLVSGPLPLNWTLELGGIALIGVSAWRAGRPSRRAWKVDGDLASPDRGADV